MLKKVTPISRKHTTEMLQLKKELKDLDSGDIESKAVLHKKINALRTKSLLLATLLVVVGASGAVSGVMALKRLKDVIYVTKKTKGLYKEFFMNRKKQSVWAQLFNVKKPLFYEETFGAFEADLRVARNLARDMARLIDEKNKERNTPLFREAFLREQIKEYNQSQPDAFLR